MSTCSYSFLVEILLCSILSVSSQQTVFDKWWLFVETGHRFIPMIPHSLPPQTVEYTLPFYAEWPCSPKVRVRGKRTKTETLGSNPNFATYW